MLNRRLIGWMLVCGWFFCGATARGWDAVLPKPKVRPASGLNLKLSVDRIGGNGYKTVHVAISSPTGKIAQSRRITITVRTPSSRMMAGVAARKTFELPRGSAAITGEIRVVHPASLSAMSVETYEAGARLNDLCIDRWANSPATTRPNGCSVLIIDADAPTWLQQCDPRIVSRMFPADSRATTAPTNKLIDVRNMLASIAPRDSPMYDRVRRAQLRGGVNFERASDRDLLRVIRNGDGFAYRPFLDLPRDWLGYARYDLVIVLWTDLNQLRVAHPECWNALRRWVETGGTLLILGGGVDDAALAKIDKTLALPHVADKDFLGGLGWLTPSSPQTFETLAGRSVIDEGGPFQFGGVGMAVTDSDPDAASSRKPSATSNKAPRDPLEFRFRNVQFGMIISTLTADPLLHSVNDWTWVFNTIGQHRWAWSKRHGIELYCDNADAWKLIAPDVGTPPVGMFVVLISIFIVVVGPVNYWLLRRWQRLYLLLVTVPVASLLVVAMTFAYALLADGLDVKLRARSLTLLDQPAQRTVSWSWQSYYASLVPAGGLRFPVHTAVYPIPGEMNDSGARDVPHMTVWSDTQQQLARGYLRSRISSPFLVVNAADTQRGLGVSGATKLGESMLVMNRLGMRVRQLVVHGGNNSWYCADDLDDEGRVELRPNSSSDGAERLRRAFSTNHLVLPPGVTPGNMSSGRGFYSRLFFGTGSSPPSIATSRIERKFTALERDAGMLPSRYYVAIVDTPPSVPTGVAKTRQVAGFHVILGRY